MTTDNQHPTLEEARSAYKTLTGDTQRDSDEMKTVLAYIRAEQQRAEESLPEDERRQMDTEWELPRAIVKNWIERSAQEES